MPVLDDHSHVFATEKFTLDPDDPVLSKRIPGLARKFVRSAYGELGLDTELAELVISEAVTNVVVHAKTPCQVTCFTPSGGVFVLEVADWSPVLPTARTAGEDDEGGRGLELIEAFAVRVEVASIPGGKVVCMTLKAVELLVLEGAA
jgi:anti-sigma regulatory factor (Ser/Thr protein kinase)